MNKQNDSQQSARHQAVQEAVGRFAPEMIDAAWALAGHHPDIKNLWIYITQEDGALYPDALYQIEEFLLWGAQLDAVVPGTDTDVEAQALMHESLASAAIRMGKELEGGLPNRLILRFAPATKNLAFDFYDGDLQPGVEGEGRIPMPDLINAWVERLKKEGVDSARP